MASTAAELVLQQWRRVQRTVGRLRCGEGPYRSVELLLEFIERAEVLGNLIHQGASGLAAAALLHALPVEIVVPRL